MYLYLVIWWWTLLEKLWRLDGWIYRAPRPIIDGAVVLKHIPLAYS